MTKLWVLTFTSNMLFYYITNGFQIEVISDVTSLIQVSCSQGAVQPSLILYSQSIDEIMKHTHTHTHADTLPGGPRALSVDRGWGSGQRQRGSQWPPTDGPHVRTHTHTSTHPQGGQGSPGTALVTVHPSVLLPSCVTTENDSRHNRKRSLRQKKKTWTHSVLLLLWPVC